MRPPDESGTDFDRLAMQFVLDLKPVRRNAVVLRLMGGLAAGVATSVVVVGSWLGYRPDMPAAVGTGMFWVKLAYVLAVGSLALGAVERLARPGSRARSRMAWILLPVAVIAALAVGQIAGAQPQGRMHMVMGGSASVCPYLIFTIALPPLAGLVWAVRGLAPTRLRIAGAMIGLAAGGFGAGVYALHCTESTAPFLAVWYSLGVIGCGGLGAALGPWVLKW